MSSNQSDLNELLRQLLQQQQQQQQSQTQQQPQQQQRQAQPAAAPAFQQHNRGPALPPNSGPLNQLENLVTQYLQSSQGGLAGASEPSHPPVVPAAQLQRGNNMLNTSLTPIQRHHLTTNANDQAQQNQQLLALSNLLSTINQTLAQQAAAFPMSQPQQQQSQFQFLEQQQHQNGPVHQWPTGFLHRQQQDNSQQRPAQSRQQLGIFPHQQKPQQQQHGHNQQQQVPEGLAQVKVLDEKIDSSREQGQLSSLTSATANKTSGHSQPSLESSITSSSNPSQSSTGISGDMKNSRSMVKMEPNSRLSLEPTVRWSADASQGDKRQLTDDLTTENARLRRQALILNYLPDFIITIGLDGKILFCNKQVQRISKYNLSDLEGVSIKQILMPESRGAIRRLIQDLEAAEHLALVREEGIDSGSDSNENGGQNNAVISRSDQSFNVLEVNVNEQDKNANGDSTSDSSGDPSKKKVSFGKSCSTTTSGTEENVEPPVKKSKNTSSSSSDWKTSGTAAMDVDDVRGDSVTANNAGAKLSSLMHCTNKDASNENERKMPAKRTHQQENASHIHRKHSLAPRAAQKQDSQSSSSTESDQRPRAGVNSSEDSGYMDSNSNGSSDEFGEDSSTSGNSMKKKGSRPRPLAPGCMVKLICQDLTTLLCELTASIRTRTPNDEDVELGMIDLNPTPAVNLLEDEQLEKEVLLCFRPILQGEKVDEELRFCQQISDTSNVNESGESA